MSKVQLIIVVFLLFACGSNKKQKELSTLKNSINQIFETTEGKFAMVFQDLSAPDNSIFINSEEKFHAASTMKTPVMIEVFKQQAEGLLSIDDTIVVKNEFKSIVDGSPYSMDIAEDSQEGLYGMIGQKTTIYHLMYEMITLSSNLATNILIDLVDAKKVTATMRSLGAERIEVLRGVEDQKAYDMGLSNSTTAKDLFVIMKAIAEGKAGNETATNKMIAILKDQKWRDIIPRFLPPEIQVANKTGSITALHHDSGIVFLPDGRKYVLILLSKELGDFNQGTIQLANISKLVYDYMVN